MHPGCLAYLTGHSWTRYFDRLTAQACFPAFFVDTAALTKVKEIQP